MNLDKTQSPFGGAVKSGPKIWLHLEGLCYFIAGLYLFSLHHRSWGFFAALFLLPDLSFAGYAFGPRIGAYAYNTLHSAVGPLILGITGMMVNSPDYVVISTIWISHVGADRMLGFGLKYSDNFKHTHLGFPFSKES
ncbi:MAG: DUF4260 domain-containing protein [Alphaproteobacteria bacterium]|jgi:hypothetical protein|nr:DUF4260 domain-containing protein [Alphaproteobacteria bacterium]